MADNVDGLTTEQTGRFTRLMRRANFTWRRSWPFLLTIFATLVLLALFNLIDQPAPPLTSDQVEAQIVAALASATPPPAYSADVYELIRPSLVIIEVQGDNPDVEEGRGLGSGVVVNSDALILTAYHVVANATTIRLGFFDGTVVAAEMVSADPANDIAVLAPQGTPGLIVPAILGNAYAMRIGDEAFAVGNPLGLTGSMSAGVISGFNRSLPINETQSLDGLIQFDTAVNPGNSGGPLLNRQGQVVGIVTALVNPSEQNFFIGIGFAVPISTAGGAAGLPSY